MTFFKINIQLGDFSHSAVAMRQPKYRHNSLELKKHFFIKDILLLDVCWSYAISCLFKTKQTYWKIFFNFLVRDHPLVRNRNFPKYYPFLRVHIGGKKG